MSMFVMADTNRDGTLSFEEFASICAKQKVFITIDQLKMVYKLIDQDASRSVSYRELTDVLLGKRTIDIVSIIKEQRIKDGSASGITKEELKKTANASIEPSYARHDTESVPKTDLTSVMRRSDVDKKDRTRFLDDSQNLQTEQAIKECFMEKARTFEDLLMVMGTNKPGQEGRVTFEDFTKVVTHFCGPQKFGSFQVKFVF